MPRICRNGRWVRSLVLIGIVLIGWHLESNIGLGQQIHRDPFEADSTGWNKGRADVPYVVEEHSRTSKASKDGQRSEYLRIQAKQGSFLYYQYPTGRAPISDELSVGLWVKGNRPGCQLMARLVLPNERDPKSLEDRMTTMIRGDVYRLTGRWQRLQIQQITRLVQEQQQLMQEQLRRPINFRDAYIDTLVINAYGGPGVNELWIDGLEIGPIMQLPPPATNVTQGKQTGSNGKPLEELPRPRNDSAAPVTFNGSQLMVGGKRFFFRGVRHSDTPLEVLRTAGFNTIWFDYSTQPNKLRAATDLGFWLVPKLPNELDNKQLVSRNVLGHEVARFPEANHVLFWDLGGSLAYEQAQVVGRSAEIVKAADPGRPVGGDVWDGFQPYSRHFNLVGVHRWPLMTGLEMTDYRNWLEQRRLLANPGAFTWTWVQTHTPDFFTKLLYNQNSKEKFNEPVGPQPAQVRLMTYTALGSGCRGIGYWSDRFLADSHQGRDRLLNVALLNKELEMLEPLLVTVDSPPQWIDTSEKDVKAAVFQTAKGILVLAMWLGDGAQFVPGQSATHHLDIVVPHVPGGNQAWEVTPGEVRGLRATRVTGGTKVRIPDFGLTTALVFTSDTKLIIRFQEHARGIRQLAAQWTYEQARQELEKVIKIQRELEALGQAVPQSAELMNDAQARLTTAKTHWERRLFSEAYREAQRSLRPLRTLMRTQWEQATKGLDSPVSVPYAVSYYTLPRYWRMVQEIRGTSSGQNVLSGGDFETNAQSTQTAWTPQNITIDEVDLHAERVSEYTLKSGAKIQPKSGRLCAMLEVTPKKGKTPPGALERTYLAVHSPATKIEPGTLVRISAWVCIPEPIKASVDGALFFDSVGGEPLGLRMTKATEWKKISLYRRVPSDGNISVSLALSGIGTVLFDDVMIEPLLGSGGTPNTVLRPAMPR